MEKISRLPSEYEYPAVVSRIRVTIPSTAFQGDTITVAFEFLDKNGFHLTGIPAKLKLEVTGGAAELVENVIANDTDDKITRITCTLLDEHSVYRIRVHAEELNITALSNPCLVADPKFASFRLYFGDIHAHRYEVPSLKLNDPILRSRGPATVDEFYRYARDMVSLDFAALTDHDYAISANEWREIQEGAEFYNQPGRFVTFLGYEWAWNSDIDTEHGHRVILFRSDRMPLISSSWRGSNTPHELYTIFDKLACEGEILSIPHHSARRQDKTWLNWSSLNGKYDRLFEIYSIWGSSEKYGEPFAIKSTNEVNIWTAPKGEYPPYEAKGHFLCDGLSKGFMFGFTAGSESHDGRAGNSVMLAHVNINETDFFHRPGITGVWTRRKTRDSIWGGLWSRRTIATTGQRSIAYMEIDGIPCGDLYECDIPPELLRGFVHACAPISSITIIKNNSVFKEIDFDSGSMDVNFEIHDIEHAQLGKSDFYYLRVTEEDGNMIWTSPIWVQMQAV